MRVDHAMRKAQLYTLVTKTILSTSNPCTKSNKKKIKNVKRIYKRSHIRIKVRICAMTGVMSHIQRKTKRKQSPMEWVFEAPADWTCKRGCSTTYTSAHTLYSARLEEERKIGEPWAIELGRFDRVYKQASEPPAGGLPLRFAHLARSRRNGADRGADKGEESAIYKRVYMCVRVCMQPRDSNYARASRPLTFCAGGYATRTKLNSHGRAAGDAFFCVLRVYKVFSWN